MTVEAYMEQHITTFPSVVAHFSGRDVKDWWYESSSLGLGPNEPVPERPFIVVNELPDFVHRTVEETSHARDRNFQIFVYDERGTFTRINAIMESLREAVKAMAPFTTDGGIRCSQAVWAGISGQIPNDGYDSGTKFASVQLTVSR